MNDRTSFYPELAKKIAPAEGKLAVLLPGLGAVSTTLIAGVDLVRRGKAKPFGSVTQMQKLRLGKRSQPKFTPIKELVPLAGLSDLVFGGWDIFPDNAYQAASKAGVLPPEHARRLEGGARGHPPVAGGLRAVVVQEPRRAERQEGRVEDGPRRRARPRHRGLPQDLGRRARRHGVVRLDRGLRAAEARARDARGVREGPQGELARHPAVDDLRLRRDPRGRPVRERRAEPLRRHPGADGARARARASRSPARTSRPDRP